MTRSSLLLCSCLLLVGVPMVALAGGEINGPTQVQAAPDGSFSFDVTFVAGPDGAEVEGWGLSDGLNTTVDEFDADGNCFEPLEPGETIPVPVEGSLDNPGSPGETFVTFHLCGDVSLGFTTTILPVAQAVPALSGWGLIAMGVLLIGMGALVFRRLA